MRFVPAVLLGTLVCGCTASKAVDSTKLIDYATRGESQVTYSVIPGKVFGEDMADKVLAIPTVPGKDVSFHAYYPDGTPHYTLDTTRSGVLDVLMAGVAGIDAEKFAQDMRTMQWISQERAAWQAMLSPLLQAAVRRYDVQTDVRASAPPAAPPESRVLDLLQELRDLGYFPAKTSP